MGKAAGASFVTVTVPELSSAVAVPTATNVTGPKGSALATTFVGHVIWGGVASRHAFVATADGSPMFKTPSPIVSAKAVILSVPGASGPEYVNPHWPAKSVAHCPPVVVAPSTTNTTETLGTGARVGDEKSLTVALIV
jgi:hypothetical protein